MSEAVWVALIGGLVAMYGVTIPLLLSARRYARNASEQVTNSHDSNLRNDIDAKHADNAGRLGSMEKRIGGVERGVRRIEQHLAIEQPQQAPPRRKK